MASEYELESSKRDSTWPGNDDFEFLELPKDFPKSGVKPSQDKNALPSSGSLSSTKNLAEVRLAVVQANHPWKSYQGHWRLGRRGAVTVAYKKNSKQEQLYTVRRIARSSAGTNLAGLCQLDHKNLVPIYEIFVTQQEFFITSPYMDVSLERINASPRYLCESQLAELIREILCGISHLASEGWLHDRINCSNILLTLKDVGGARASEVKITGIESCRKSVKGDAGRTDGKALGVVMMKVMEKDSQPKDTFGLRHPERWSEDAVEFLSMTQVATPEELAEHQLVANHKQHGSLVRLIAFTNVAAFGGFYNYDKSAELF